MNYFKKMQMWNCYLMLFFLMLNVSAQNSNESPWIIGAGVNTINDSGLSNEGLFNLKRNYSFSRPFKFSVEKKINLKNGIELKALLNRFKTNKKFNNGFPTEDIDFFGLDLMYKYYFLYNDQPYSLHRTKKLSMYGTIGPGVSFFSDLTNITINLGVGVNYPIAKQFELNLQFTPKISATNSAFSNNYYQFEFGVLYYLKN